MRSIILCISVLFLICATSCRNKKGDFEITGTIINAGSKKPIDSVMVILFGGNPSSTGIGAVDDLNDNPPNGNNDTTYTDKDGYFSVKIKKESYSFIGIYKEGYRSPTYYTGNKVRGDNHFTVPGEYKVRIEYVAECSFYPIFMKIGNNSDIDTLRVFLDTEYKNFPRNFPLAYAEKYVGISPFTYLNSRAYGFVGDTYVYYKLEYTDNGTWKTKIDSVYIKSFETYTDTIYY
ncbi:MAG TPA: hypothetical protein P5243_10085 [Bacteroidales bacterium]|jgi:hypothetical protein|nr:hypothetical protein [Bacteroidales bacterium]